MSIRANSNSKFLRRFLLIAAVCIGYVLWGGYDALVTGPKKMKMAKAHWMEANEEGQTGWVKRHAEDSGEWTQVAKENNWPIGAPKTPASVQGYIYFNYALVAVCLLAGSIAIFKFTKVNNTWVEAEDGRLKTSWNEEFAFSDILTINKRRWERKGIAVITYSTPNGESQFFLDDFKYVRKETDEILFLMEQQLTDDQILEGSRELSPEEKAEAKRLVEAKRQELDVIEDE